MKRLVSIALLLVALILTLSSCAPYERGALKVGVHSEGSQDGSQIIFTVAAVNIDRFEERIKLCEVNTVDCTINLEDENTANAPKIGSEDEAISLEAKNYTNKVIGLNRKEISALTSADFGKEMPNLERFKAATLKAMENPFFTPVRASSEAKIGIGLEADSYYLINADTFECILHFAAVITDGGIVAAATIDSTDAFADYGGVTNPENPTVTLDLGRSKQELLEEYGMVKYGGAQAEWYVQAQRFADTAKGKYYPDIHELPTENIAGCTISCDDYKPLLYKAAHNADNKD